MVRREWNELPQDVRISVEAHSGAVTGMTVPAAGRNSHFCATLHTSTGPVFCKGSLGDTPQGQMHRNEARVQPFLPALAPRLLWQVETSGWLLLGFEHVTGRYADLTPGSSDLPRIAEAVTTMGSELTPCPPVQPLVLADKWKRLSAWRRIRQTTPGGVDPETRYDLDCLVEWEQQAVDLVDGDTLLHTDLHQLNILVDTQVHIIDWAWSYIGAPWVDVAYLVIRLIDDGHEPADAEKWAASVPAWHTATEEAKTAFAVAVLGIWQYLQRDDPTPHRTKLTDAARTWATHRLAHTPHS